MKRSPQLPLLLCICMICSACHSSARTPGVDVAPTEQFRHKVQHTGETLGAISGWYTGRVENWRIIQAHNNIVDPDRLQIGSTIVIPGDLVHNRTPFPAHAARGRRTPVSKVKPPLPRNAGEEGPASPPEETPPQADPAAAVPAAPEQTPPGKEAPAGPLLPVEESTGEPGDDKLKQEREEILRSLIAPRDK